MMKRSIRLIVTMIVAAVMTVGMMAGFCMAAEEESGQVPRMCRASLQWQ